MAKLFWPSFEMQASLAQVVRLSGTNCVCVCGGGAMIFCQVSDIFFRIRKKDFPAFDALVKKTLQGRGQSQRVWAKKGSTNHFRRIFMFQSEIRESTRNMNSFL